HLAEREQRGGRHVLGAELRRVLVECLLAPDEERQVVADAAQERLEAVVVRVDRAGHHRAGRPVDPPRTGSARIALDLVGCADPDDRAVDREHARRIAHVAAARSEQRAIRGDEDAAHTASEIDARLKSCVRSAGTRYPGPSPATVICGAVIASHAASIWTG